MSNNIDNPYFTLAEQLKHFNQNNQNNVQPVLLGKIIKLNPFLIDCNGIQLDEDDLIINKYFKNYEFKENTEFVLLTSDNQKYILLCEVI